MTGLDRSGAEEQSSSFEPRLTGTRGESDMFWSKTFSRRFWCVPLFLLAILLTACSASSPSPKPQTLRTPSSTPASTITGPITPGLKISTVVVLDTLYLTNGQLFEVTLDWYAQDDQRNVWYFGEYATQYMNGQPVSPRSRTNCTLPRKSYVQPASPIASMLRRV